MVKRVKPVVWALARARLVTRLTSLSGTAKMSSPKLPYRFLGTTGVKVTSLCLGTMTFGQAGVSVVMNTHSIRKRACLIDRSPGQVGNSPWTVERARISRDIGPVRGCRR